MLYALDVYKRQNQDHSILLQKYPEQYLPPDLYHPLSCTQNCTAANNAVQKGF